FAPLGQHGDRIAVRQPGGPVSSVSYAALAMQRDRIAAALTARGVKRGDVVALLLERTPAMVSALLGTLAVGATYLPLDPGFPLERLVFMIADAGAKLMI